MINSSQTMKEIVLANPLFAEFLVSKGFPFTLENPVVEFVTFDDVCELQHLNQEEFLDEFYLFEKKNN